MSATLQPKQPEAKKKYPDDFGMTGFGFVRREDTGQWVPKGIYEAEQKAKHDAEEQLRTDASKEAKRLREREFLNDQKQSEEVKEEILTQIGLSKKNLDFYKKLYADGNTLNVPDKTKPES